MTIMVKHLTSNMVMFYFTHNQVMAWLPFQKNNLLKKWSKKQQQKKQSYRIKTEIVQIEKGKKKYLKNREQ